MEMMLKCPLVLPVLSLPAWNFYGTSLFSAIRAETKHKNANKSPYRYSENIPIRSFILLLPSQKCFRGNLKSNLLKYLLGAGTRVFGFICMQKLLIYLLLGT